MTTPFDRFKQRQRELVQDALEWTDNVTIYTPSENYTAGEGYSLSYPDTPDLTIDCALMTPSEASQREDYGTYTDTDLVAEIPSDVPDSLTDGLDGYGESGEGLARFEVTETGEIYEVETIENPQNGILVIGLGEL